VLFELLTGQKLWHEDRCVANLRREATPKEAAAACMVIQTLLRAQF
jgi:hypothetical protein